MFCEYLCSCSTLLLIGAVSLWITGFYFYFEVGSEGNNFLLSVGVLSIAGLLTLCSISCFFDVAGRANKLMKNKKQMERALSVKKVNCPGKHGLRKFVTQHDGYGCDVCSRKFPANTPLFGCRRCNYDACLECKPEIIAVDEEKDDAKDDNVTCDKKHVLLQSEQVVNFRCAECDQEQNGDTARPWRCNEGCDYALCDSCFGAKSEKLEAKKQNFWMSKEARESADEYPILTCGLIGWPLLFALAFFFGSDISVLNVIADYECDIIGGSDSISVAVSTFLEVGAWLHISLLCSFVCCGCCSGITDSDAFGGLAVCGLGCGWLFFVAWAAVGFVIESEMTSENVLDDAQCIPALSSWCAIKIIEMALPFVGVCCVGLLGMAKSAGGDVSPMEVLGKTIAGCCVGVFALFVLAFLFGSDIAMLVVESNQNCALALTTDSLVPIVNWMYSASIAHLIAVPCAFCVAVIADEAGFGSGKVLCGACCSWVFFVTWTVFGLLMWLDMDTDSAQNKQCADVVLSWSVMKGMEFVVLPFCAFCFAVIS